MGKVVLIQLTRGRFARVDARDASRVMMYSWSFTKTSPRTEYAQGYVDGRKCYMHRFILGLTDGRVQVDHKDHDGLNNVRSNLRKCTHKQNRAHAKGKPNRSSAPTSKYIGVSRRSINSDGWQAFIKLNGRSAYLGTFDTETAAARAYDAEARRRSNEFATLNFPDARGPAPKRRVHVSPTHCPRGHSYSESNLYLSPNGSRVCRVCQAAATRRWMEKKARQ